MGIINQNWLPHVYTHIHTSHVKRHVSRSLCIPRKRRRQRRALPIRTYRFAFFTFIVSKNCRQLLEIPASFPMTRAIPSKCSSHFRGDRSIDGISEQTAVIGRFPRRFRRSGSSERKMSGKHGAMSREPHREKPTRTLARRERTEP